jgi:FixJ family two-component response regulator
VLAMHAGAAEFLPEPINADALATVVNRYS